MLLNCIARDDMDRKISLTFASKITGAPGSEECFADADGYSMVFYCRSGSLTNLKILRTPSGKEYHADHDGGQPVCSHMEVADWNSLAAMILGFNEKAAEESRPVRVAERYVVVIDDDEKLVGPAFNHGPSPEGFLFPIELSRFPVMFRDRGEAEKAASAFAKYWRSKSSAAPRKTRKPKKQ